MLALELIERARLNHHSVQHRQLVRITVGDVHGRGRRALRIRRRVQLDGRLGGAKSHH